MGTKQQGKRGAVYGQLERWGCMLPSGEKKKRAEDFVRSFGGGEGVVKMRE